ncbi:alpha/beta fold hydrolase [Fodinicurvata halophila]|uniref:Alpha/beta fold hydrolase n=2 Tax=Fodinicurvata halophila TaxID=1419723 RepID=A0ABV8UL38_9PROT
MTERTPLALLPGLLLDEDLWSHQLEELKDVADIRVGDFSTQNNVADMAQSVLEMMPERFALAGLSMGGYVAQEIMRQAPERVERLALLDTRASPDEDEVVARRKDLMKLAERGRFRGVTPRLLPMLVHEDRLEDRALCNRILAMAERIGRDGFIRQQEAILNRPDFRPTLARITCPTLVLCGREDKLTPVALHREMAAGIATSRMVVLEHSGHLPPMEKPEETTVELRRWLTEQA